MMVMNKELKELKEQKGFVVVMAGDDGGEQKTERTEQKGFATVDVMNCRQKPFFASWNCAARMVVL